MAHAKALNANDIRGPIVRAQYECSLERESTHHPARTVLGSALWVCLGSQQAIKPRGSEIKAPSLAF